MIGKDGVEETFGRQFSNRFNIHRTRQNFPNNGIDTFENIAQTGLSVTDMVVTEELVGTIELSENVWIIPAKSLSE